MVVETIPLAPPTLVIGDLHLPPDGGPRTEAFVGWLDGLDGLGHLVVLGDLFDTWVGPKQVRLAGSAAVLDGLGRLVARGASLELVHGNRDYLLGADFERRTGGRVHPDGFVGVLGDGPDGRVLFLHGDELCTRDLAYQRMKRILRSRVARWVLPRLPFGFLQALARRMRTASVQAIARKLPDEKTMQVGACREWAARFSAGTVVCGHAHVFRDDSLEGGTRWLVIDGWEGERDTLRFEGPGDLVAGRSAELA